MDWRLICADVLDGLSQLEPWSVDAVVTDPPYGERNAGWDGPRSIEWHAAWIEAAHRVLRPGAPLVTFCGRRSIDLVMGALRGVRGDSPDQPLQSAVWIHRQGYPVGRGMLRPEHEPIVVSGCLRVTAPDVRRLREYRTPHNVQRNATKRNIAARGFKPYVYRPDGDGPMAGTTIEAARNKPAAESTGHPTQKPERVIEELVRLAAEPGATVLDPFAGSGTTGVVALRAGRRFIGVEIDPEYVEIARRRIESDAPLLNRGGAA